MATSSTVSILTACLLAGCTSADPGPVESPAATEASQTPAEESNFAMEFNPESCSSSHEIPDEYAAPEEFGYIEEFTTPDFHESLWCTYLSGTAVESLNGIEAIVLANSSLQFTITDGESSLTPAFTGSDVNFEENPIASYFKEWSKVSQKIAVDHNVPMEDSKEIRFELFANWDNLYLAVGMTFVVPDEIALDDGDYVPEAEVASAAYEILDVLVPPVVDGLERE